MNAYGTGAGKTNCERYAHGSNARECENKEPELFLPEQVTCPYEKDLLQSMRLQGIIMQQMRHEITKNRQVFKVFLRPTSTRKHAKAENSCCTGDVDIVEEMVDELRKDLVKVRSEFEQDKKRRGENAVKDNNKSQCYCGLF